MKQLALLPLFALFVAPSAWAVIALNGPTDDWTALQLGGRSDFLEDEQAQSEGGDIVGSETDVQSGFYKQYFDGGDNTLSGDELAFRARLAGVPTSHIFVGIDIKGVGNPGAIDFFIDVSVDNNQSKHDVIAFYRSGSATDPLANTSPSSTDIAHYDDYIAGDSTSPLFGDFASFDEVTTTNDSYYTTGAGAQGTNDIDGAGSPDYFVSFKIDMVALNTAFLGMFALDHPTDPTPADLTENTEMSFILMTANNPNALNQDFGGVEDDAFDYDPDGSWDELGISSSPYTASGESPVPEPATYALLLGFSVLGVVAVRRRR